MEITKLTGVGWGVKRSRDCEGGESICYRTEVFSDMPTYVLSCFDTNLR